MQKVDQSKPLSGTGTTQDPQQPHKLLEVDHVVVVAVQVLWQKKTMSVDQLPH